MKKYTLRFGKVNKETFEAIKNGKKTVETRAASIKYQNIEAGDIIVLSCDGHKFEKKVKHAQTFKNIKSMLRKYKIKSIEPKLSTADQLRDAYYSYTGYKEKIKKFGIIAMELK